MRYLNWNRNILLSLLLLMGLQVQAQNEPDWSVNPGEFQFSMTMVASLRLDNSLSMDANDRIGVFVGAELRGTGFLNINVPSTNTQVAFIQIYSNEVSGEELTFKVYDDSEDKLLDLVNEETFVDAKKLGENLDPYELTDNHLITDITLSISSIDENLTAGSLTSTIGHNDIDKDQTYTFSLVTGEGDTHNADFSVTGDQLKLNKTYDYEALSAVSIRLKVVDSKNAAYEEAISLDINDINDSPTAISLSDNSFAENTVSGTDIGSFSSTDQDAGDSHTYELVSGTGDTNNELFTIAGGQLQTASSFDFETLSALSIRVKSTDAAGASVEQDFALSLEDVNDAPQDITLSNAAISENTASNSLIGSLSTSDPDAVDSHSYAFASGTGADDNSSFTIRNGDELFSTTSFDFEAKNSYSIRLSTTDGEGEVFEKAFEITISDANDAPTDLSLSANVIDENLASGQKVADLSASDEDTGDAHTFSLVAGDGDEGNANFSISGSQLLTNASLDFEAAASQSIRLQVSDQSGATFQKVVSITVNDQNDAPSAIALSSTSIAENNALGDLLGTLSSTDQDATDTHSYALVAGTGDEDNGSFEVNGSQLQAKQVFDFEQQSSYSVRIRSTDNDGASLEEAFTIAIRGVNEVGSVISLSANKLDENQSAGEVIGELSTTDPDVSESFTYTLISGEGDTGNGQFEIVGTELKSKTEFDHETQSSYNIRVRSTDAKSNSLEEVFTILVRDINEAPSTLALSVNNLAENSTQNSLIGNLSTTDIDEGDSFVYSFATGTGDDDNALFTIQGNALYSTTNFDFESKSTYSVRVATTDQGGVSLEQTFTINVTDANDAPESLGLSTNSIDENNAAGDLIGNLSVTDQDAGDSHTYALVAGDGDDDNASFQVSGAELQAGQVFDFESKSSFTIRLRSTDSEGASTEASFEITVNDLNEASTALSLSNDQVAENSSQGTSIGAFSTTDEDAGDTFSYALVAGEGDAGNTAFTVENGQLKTASAMDYETQSSLSIRVRSTDGGGNSIENTFAIQVTNVNEAPTSLSLSNNTVEENSLGGTLVGQLEAVDEDVDDFYAYVLKDQVEDNASFGINGGNQLVVAGTLNFEEKSSYEVVIEAIDSDGNRFERTYTIAIINVPEAGVNVSNRELDFGNVAVGQSEIRSITIDNTGPDGVLNVSSIELPDGFTADQPTLEVQPGENTILNLSFEPTEATQVEDIMKLITNAGVVEIGIVAQAEVVTSIDDPVDLSPSVQLFPNPANERLVLDLGSFANQAYDLKIVGANGKPMLSLSESRRSQVEINISTWPEGMYIVRINGEGRVARKKVLVRR